MPPVTSVIPDSIPIPSSVVLEYSLPVTSANAVAIPIPSSIVPEYLPPATSINANIPLPSASASFPPIGVLPPFTLNSLATNSADNPKYRFNAGSSTNIAVYYGQSPATSTTTLTSQCADPNIDIVILAFVISQLDGGKYPSINFGAACGGQTQMMINEAPGLLWCPGLASQIQICQATYGKKVLLSVGGSTSKISFSGPGQAQELGDVLWDVFGPAGNVDPQLRPFGTVEVDGFDIDNEDNMPAHFDALALTLRNHFSHTTAKTYYLSSAPQCPFPDASDPMALLLLCDFVWVQFYNNPSCEIGSAGFSASLKQWSQVLSTSTMATKPKFYLGAPAWSAAGPTAYEGIGGPEGMMGIAEHVEGMKMHNFGGVMFWDGSEGVINVQNGKDIIAWAKEGLTA
ncbi:glycoside hydrolase [Mollisia scopiformis]|uniref:chitinase n=1 Tax=Mollisia scopiformis TaxID=149040 RepID=A0A194XDT4_MOLSC|nr:glycoside hydrolase [Mollisia scopiformis]KUJ18345.1 glycoside hydrolase [Mollisia scopiformis]